MKTFFLSLLISISIVTSAQRFRIKEHSRLAIFMAKTKKEETWGFTIGRTVYINCSAEVFLDKEWWVRHEFCHLQQYQRYGTLEFLKRYLFFSIFKGYNNRFEREAKKAENE